MYNVEVQKLQNHYYLKEEKIKGVVLHFDGPGKPWKKESGFYKEWQNNLELAEKIDLKNIPPAAKIFSDNEMMRYQKYLQGRKIVRDAIKVNISRSKYYVGRMIKSVSPRFYYYLGGQN